MVHYFNILTFLEFNRPIYFCFIDIEKAFDKIRLKHVLNILRELGVPSSILSLIQDIYTHKSDVWLTVHRNSVWIRKTN